MKVQCLTSGDGKRNDGFGTEVVISIVKQKFK